MAVVSSASACEEARSSVKTTAAVSMLPVGPEMTVSMAATVSMDTPATDTHANVRTNCFFTE